MEKSQNIEKSFYTNENWCTEAKNENVQWEHTLLLNHDMYEACDLNVTQASITLKRNASRKHQICVD